MKTTNSFNGSAGMIRFQIGLIIALSVVLLAFEWKTYDVRSFDNFNSPAFEPESDLVIQTVQKKKIPPKPKPKPQITMLKEIANDEIDDDIIVDAEIGEDDPNPEPPEVDLPEEEPVNETPIYNPGGAFGASFPGGEAALITYLAANIKYSETARELGISGKVYISFVVERDGSISSIEVERGLPGGLSEEAVKVIRNMPRWKPATQNGVPVRVKMVVPINFKLQ